MSTVKHDATKTPTKPSPPGTRGPTVAEASPQPDTPPKTKMAKGRKKGGLGLRESRSETLDPADKTEPGTAGVSGSVSLSNIYSIDRHDSADDEYGSAFVADKSAAEREPSTESKRKEKESERRQDREELLDFWEDVWNKDTERSSQSKDSRARRKKKKDKEREEVEDFADRDTLKSSGYKDERWNFVKKTGRRDEEEDEHVRWTEKRKDNREQTWERPHRDRSSSSGRSRSTSTEEIIRKAMFHGSSTSSKEKYREISGEKPRRISGERARRISVTKARRISGEKARGISGKKPRSRGSSGEKSRSSPFDGENLSDVRNIVDENEEDVDYEPHEFIHLVQEESEEDEQVMTTFNYI